MSVNDFPFPRERVARVLITQPQDPDPGIPYTEEAEREIFKEVEKLLVQAFGPYAATWAGRDMKAVFIEWEEA